MSELSSSGSTTPDYSNASCTCCGQRYEGPHHTCFNLGIKTPAPAPAGGELVAAIRQAIEAMPEGGFKNEFYDWLGLRFAKLEIDTRAETEARVRAEERERVWKKALEAIRVRFSANREEDDVKTLLLERYANTVFAQPIIEAALADGVDLTSLAKPE